ncbi:hypothetical protein Tco_0321659 [Tanacetum coccineum]
MAISVVLISSDSSEESVGTSNARVILFGTIPIAILTNVLIVDPPVVHDDTPLIPTETHTIPPVVSTLPHTSPFMHTDSSDSDTSERPPSQDPYEVTIAQWRSRVAACSLPPSSPTHDSSPTDVTPPTLCLLVSRYPPDHSSSDHFSLDDSSSDSSPDASSDYSSDSSSGHSLPDSSIDAPATISAGPSRERCRSLAISVPLAIPIPGALPPVHMNLLPPRKRTRGAVTASDYDDSTKESYEAYTEPDIDY